VVDVVVVSYNSRDMLRGCVEPLVGIDGVNVTVVDNASQDGSLDVIADLPVRVIPSPRNGGFAYGCNLGWRSGEARYVLLLNPDARLDEASLRELVRVMDEDERIAIAAPRILEADGSLDYSQRRFPRLRSTYSQALFLHRVFPHAPWSDETNRDTEEYRRQGSPDWVSGACMLLRRSLLDRLNGLDEGFFMYGEDKDLCRRARDLGLDIRFVPDAVCVHAGGQSAPRAALLPVLASSRVRYARKHDSRGSAGLERAGICLGSLTHAAFGRGKWGTRKGHLRAFSQAALHPPARPSV
jgi:GT2 family glycosyltransferase